eukprot:TRINITY_DN38506_c0_g1_i1.p1 TRINITY_DN38506_c0_g1~~TRINITY_DN38506_c0_g1_i1.p1  ORF type:complete len:160 (-),score=11.09 TRINITY_DN38506_c0_g1_i1:253-732(-)
MAAAEGAPTVYSASAHEMDRSSSPISAVPAAHAEQAIHTMNSELVLVVWEHHCRGTDSEWTWTARRWSDESGSQTYGVNGSNQPADEILPAGYSWVGSGWNFGPWEYVDRFGSADKRTTHQEEIRKEGYKANFRSRNCFRRVAERKIQTASDSRCCSLW